MVNVRKGYEDWKEILPIILACNVLVARREAYAQHPALQNLLILNGVGRNHYAAFHIGNSLAVYAPKPMRRAGLQNQHISRSNLPSKPAYYAVLRTYDVRITRFCER
jgi:hypothetical protein